MHDCISIEIVSLPLPFLGGRFPYLYHFHEQGFLTYTIFVKKVPYLYLFHEEGFLTLPFSWGRFPYLYHFHGEDTLPLPFHGVGSLTSTIIMRKVFITSPMGLMRRFPYLHYFSWRLPYLNGFHEGFPYLYHLWFSQRKQTTDRYFMFIKKFESFSYFYKDNFLIFKNLVRKISQPLPFS
jgi:hypothetical protein